MCVVCLFPVIFVAKETCLAVSVPFPFFKFILFYSITNVSGVQDNVSLWCVENKMCCHVGCVCL